MPSYSSLSKKEAPLYDDLINFPRAKDKDEMRCVMCGLPPGDQCVIPRQNKDVCKDCDKATWQHIATQVYFKWCKGCKKFLKLGSFSQKLDAAKCDKCRERGRQSYLLKKGKDGDETAATPASFHHSHRHHRSAHNPPPQSVYHTRGLRSLFREDDDGRSDFGDDLSIDEDPEAFHHQHHQHHHPHHHATPDRRQSVSSASSDAGGKQSDEEAAEGHDEEDGANADQTLSKMKLSTNFGLPLHHLQVDPSSMEDQLPTTTSAGVAGPAGNNLRELARIHQRIVELEKTAEQVHIITSKLKEEQSRGRRLEVTITQLQQDLQAANSESERLRNELQAWYEREEELLRREMAVGGNEKRTRSDSINGAAALLGGFKKQRVLEQEEDREGEGGAGAPDDDEKRSTPADVGRPSHIVSL